MQKQKKVFVLKSGHEFVVLILKAVLILCRFKPVFLLRGNVFTKRKLINYCRLKIMIYICIPTGRFMNETKQHILKTALVLFLRKSYRDVTMKEIVDKTGLSKGAFYHYFESKDDLFKEIVYMFFSMGEINYDNFSGDSLEIFYTQYVDFLDNAMREIDSLVNYSDDYSSNHNFYVILFEAVRRFPEFLEVEYEFHEKDVAAWVKIISTAKQKGEIVSQSSDTDIADLFLYCTDGVFLRYINSCTNDSYRTFLKRAYDAIYNNLKA